jgi:hypothetical protein
MADSSNGSSSEVKAPAELEATNGVAGPPVRREDVSRERTPADPVRIGRGKGAALVLTAASAILFVVGIVAPSFTMVPKLGDGYFERFVRLFMRDELAPRTFSLVGGVWQLLRGGDLFVGGVILLFSVVFPIAKLATLAMTMRAESGSAERHLGLLEQLGKWSMLDVFVVAALVVCFKGFPGGSHVQVEWGIYVFAASVVLSMLATRAMRKWHSGAAHQTEHR